MAASFVPDDFDPPATFAGDGFRLEPLGPQHNERDHEAWMSSIVWIQSTPGYDRDADWPVAMNLESNLKDLEMHARHFTERSGFTYSILDGDDVIGCLYIYPGEGTCDASIRSWVRASRSEMDLPVYLAVSAWVGRSWPFVSPEYASRPED